MVAPAPLSWSLSKSTSRQHWPERSDNGSAEGVEATGWDRNLKGMWSCRGRGKGRRLANGSNAKPAWLGLHDQDAPQVLHVDN